MTLIPFLIFLIGTVSSRVSEVFFCAMNCTIGGMFSVPSTLIPLLLDTPSMFERIPANASNSSEKDKPVILSVPPASLYTLMAGVLSVKLKSLSLPRVFEMFTAPSFQAKDSSTLDSFVTVDGMLLKSISNADPCATNSSDLDTKIS